MFLFAAGPAVLQGLLMTCVPESPGWLRRKGRVAEAEAAETALWGAPDAAAAGGDGRGGLLAYKGAYHVLYNHNRPYSLDSSQRRSKASLLHEATTTTLIAASEPQVKQNNVNTV
jgi:hypothetical protein